MLRKAMQYGLATGLPGLINFLAVAVYTRLLDPSEYGRYALVLAGVAVANAVGFQWLRAAVRRFLAAEVGRASLLATVRVIFLWVAGVGAVVGLLAARLAPLPLRPLLLLAIPLLAAQAWFELNQDVQLIDLRAGRYGVAALLRSLIALTLGVALAASGWGALGVITGLLVGYAVPGVMMALVQFRRMTWTPVPERALSARLVAFGLPLAAGYTLQFVLDTSDRVMLGWFHSSAEVGPYAAAYDLSQQSLMLLMMVVNLAAYPLALRALEEEGPAAASVRLREHAELLAAVSFPAVTGLALLAGPVAQLVLGAGFRATATSLIPVLAMGVFLGGWKALYFDLAFHFAERTRVVALIGAAGAVLNILLNLVLLPRYGAVGAAWTTLATFACVCLASAWLGRPAFHLPLPWLGWARVLAATAVMATAVLGLRQLSGTSGLMAAVAGGIIAYAAAAIALDVIGTRSAARGLGRRLQVALQR